MRNICTFVFMKTIAFYKYQGTGNDFVMIDNRSDFFPKDNVSLINFLCDRRFGIGGDGLILLEKDDTTDFKMVYYNADGNESTMCGNGGRCIVAFAKDLNIIDNKTTFIAIDGLHHAEILQNNTVSLQMIDVAKNSIQQENNHYFLFTGSPHHVELTSTLNQFDVFNTGKNIRYSTNYQPGGTNVNFVEELALNHFKIRTYERGVEDETLSCGTGATAVALAMYHDKKATSNKIAIDVEGGSLEVSFDEDDTKYSNVHLTGPAKQVFKGEIATHLI